MSRRDRDSVTGTEPRDLPYGQVGGEDPYRPGDGFGWEPVDPAHEHYADGHYGDGHSGDGDFTDAGFFDEDGHDPEHVPDVYLGVGRHESRADRSRKARKRRNRRFVAVMMVLLLAVIGVSAWLVGVPIYRYFNPDDYSGQGTGSVTIVVRANDDASQIGQTLVDDGVVASVRAFTDAANNDADSASIQPGSYVLHNHMSGVAALNLLLSPSSRINSDVVVTEGATVVDIRKRLTSPVCTAKSAVGQVCGLGLSGSDVTKALADVKALGIPTDYAPSGSQPASPEGFLFPATYAFDDKTTATNALEQMVAKFTDVVRATDFTARAKALGLTPYQELVVASIAQAEAKYPSDMAKVARVILNRLHAGRDLQIDATSAYAAKLAGLDPSKTIYKDVKGPYNTYTHSGLPPTPIGNPGEDALKAAAHPPAGNWLYYVNVDAQGHLGFFHSETAFTKAVQKCKAQGWGCG